MKRWQRFDACFGRHLDSGLDVDFGKQRVLMGVLFRQCLKMRIDSFAWPAPRRREGNNQRLVRCLGFLLDRVPAGAVSDGSSSVYVYKKIAYQPASLSINVTIDLLFSQHGNIKTNEETTSPLFFTKIAALPAETPAAPTDS